MIKLFTHVDLDGCGCALVAFLKYEFLNVDVEYCDYNNVNDKVRNFLNSNETKGYDSVFITDISVNNDIAKRIDKINKDNKFMLFDHHPTALELNKYKWANVEIMLNEKEKTSGTKMFYDYLKKSSEKGTPIKQSCVRKFVDTVRKYDTWQWKEENNYIPKRWNDLLYILGREDFVESLMYRLFDGKFEFTDFDNKILELRQREIDSYVKSKEKQLISKNILGYNAGVVFAEQYSSELGNRLCDMHPEYDFIVLINMGSSISYRSVGDKVDLGKDIASVYGGGGHPNASGSPLNDEIRNAVINMIFEIPNKETIQAIEDEKNNHNMSKKYSNVDEMIKDLEKD